MTRIDETSLQILRLLQENGRMSLTELAQAVHRAESSVRERVGSLELHGYIRGYQAKVDWARLGLPGQAIVRARCDLTRVESVARRLGTHPLCTQAVLVTGAKPVLAMLRVRDAQHLQTVLRDLVADASLQDVEAELALESLVEERAPSSAVNPTPAGPPPLPKAFTLTMAPEAGEGRVVQVR
jgi:Lrp/AsnC family transcriptional regulator, leucine-responsive regulatory protein